jgi:excisionase family DNA binding protein
MMNIDDSPISDYVSENQAGRENYSCAEKDAEFERAERDKIRAYTIKRFCRTYSTSRSKTYELIAAGALQAVKNGKRTLIPVESAERWLASLPQMKGGSRDA